MKKYSLSILLLPMVLLLLLPSCEDFLETDSQSTYTDEVLYSTATATEQALIGAYALAGMDEMYSIRLNMYYTMSSDIEIVASDANQYNDNERRSIGHYLATSGNSQLTNPWNALYRAIERTNLIVANIPQSPIMATGTADDKKKMQQYLGEAMTLRAMYYMELVRNWGDVPFKMEATSPDGSNFYLGKTNRDTIYNRLIADLLVAEGLVPWIGEGTVGVPTRITKGFVKGLIARMCLYRGGYSLRAETNRMQRGSDWQTYYELARQQCKEVIDKGKYQLNPSFANFFYKQCQLQTDAESVFELGFGMNESSELGGYIGVRVHENSAKYGTTSGGVLTYPSYLYMFEPKDTRRLVTCAIYGIRNLSNRIRDSIYPSPVDYRVGKWSQRDMTEKYLQMKANNSTKIFTGINWPVMRYSDVLLMFAETDNELNGPTADAQAAFKQVRLRALGSANEQAVNDYMAARCVSQSGFREAIRDERALEFGGEGIRKYDLVRWNALDKIELAKEQSRSIANSGTYTRYDGTSVTVPTSIYYKYEAGNPEKLDFASVALDLETIPLNTAGYYKMSWFPMTSASNKTKFNDFMGIVAKGLTDHPNRHLLPLSDATVTDSKGSLKNDYGF